MRLDVLRGGLQLTIFVSHVIGSWFGTWAIYGAWGLSDSSEQFVLLSGFTLGSVFALKRLRGGMGVAVRDILLRVARLWRVHLVVAGSFAVLVWGAGDVLFPDDIGRTGWDWLVQAPVCAVLGLASTLYQPGYTGILPVFIWCMLLLPFFMLVLERAGPLAFGMPVAAWLAAQSTGFDLPHLAPGGTHTFNPFAWALLYALGAWLGRRALLHGRALPFDACWANGASAAALLILAVGLAIRLGWYGVSPALVVEAPWLIGKENLALPRMLHALALAWLVARHVPRQADWMFSRAGQTLAAVGRHSLEVFCLGLFLSWTATAVLRLQPSGWVDAAVITLGGTLLILFACWKDRSRKAAAVSPSQASAVRQASPPNGRAPAPSA